MSKMSEHFDDFLKRSITDGDRPNTVKSKENSVKHLRSFFGEDEPNGVTAERWLAFCGSRAANINLFNCTKHFRAICKFLHESGLLEKRPKIFNPRRKKEAIARRRKKSRIYSLADVRSIEACCNGEQQICLYLGYDMAFRMDDCLRLTWDRVILEGDGSGFIIFHGDDNKTEFVGKCPMSSKVYELLMIRMTFEIAALGGLVFKAKSSAQMNFKSVIEKSGIGFGTFHTLRHTRLTEDFGNPDLPQAMVCKIRRVSLAVALEHYIHPSDSDMEKFRNTAKNS
jgi:integrase